MGIVPVQVGGGIGLGGADLLEIGLGSLRNGLGQAGGSPAGRKVSHKHHQNLSFPVFQALGVL